MRQSIKPWRTIIGLAVVVSACTTGGIADTTAEPTPPQGDGGTTSSAATEEPTSAEPSDDTLVVGAAIAQSGGMAPFDLPIFKGFELGVAQINDAGGIGGSIPIEVIVRDVRTDAQQTVVAVEELVEAGAEVLVLVCSGDLALAAAPTIQQARIPSATLCASQPSVQDIGGEYVFGNVFGDNAQAAVSAQYARDQGYETAFLLLSPDNLFVEGMPRFFGQAFEDRGGEVIGEAQYSLGQQDFGAVITQIEGLSPQPDVIMTAAFEPDFPAFIRQLRAAGVDIPVIGADGLDTPTTADIGSAADGVVYTSIGIPAPGNTVERFVQDYQAHFGEDPESFYAPVGFDLARVLEAAVLDAGSTEPTAIRDAWASLEEVPGATGPITYAGTNRTPIKPVTLVRIEQGEFVPLDVVIPDPADIPQAS